MRSKIKSLLPKHDANKYSRGKLTIFAGSSCYEGAALLCAMSGSRFGCGYVELYTEDEYIPLVQISYPSLVVSSYRKWSGERPFVSSKDRPQAVCVGPGMPAHDEFYDALIMQIANQSHCPLVVDAGALSYVDETFATDILFPRQEKGYATIFTPHYGEACALASRWGIDEKDPKELARLLSKCLRSTVILKGPTSYVVHYDNLSRVDIFDKGTPALAKAGTGDILAGMLSSLLSQNMDKCDAINMTLELHACAACIAAERLSQISVIPEDIIEAIPAAFKYFLSDRVKENE